MAHRIEVVSKIPDARAQLKKRQLESAGFSGRLDEVQIADIYTIDFDIDERRLRQISSMLSNDTFQEVGLAELGEVKSPERFDYAVEIGFLPGVTDNVGSTARESVEDLLKTELHGQAVYSSQIAFLSGRLSREDAKNIGELLANSLIERIHIKSYGEFQKDKGMGIVIPRVRLETRPGADLVGILNANDEELSIIGKQGIANRDGTRRGPLALDLTYMKAIQSYFREQGRNPTDIELESIAQTWSEQCKHTIFADTIDEIKEGLFNRYIKGATQTIRKKKGEKDFCVSVFSDNSGIIRFDEKNNLAAKIETHNTPSALDPFGGSITGIVGVNRDSIGAGLGSEPFANISGAFCFADPSDINPLYKGKNFTQRMQSPRQILDGVVEGVKVGGNCSGIPTSHFRLLFDERYKGKPLVYVGTLGIMPRESAGRASHEKSAKPGDYIVMVGGRVGKDGIHGATFSSEALDSGSPSTAVQIGDPITQKKMSDALVKEARDLDLYNSITDNGAGGLSCSVAEMARESGGCHVVLDNVPLKYPGLAPWETWVSESQERMTLSVPKEKWETFSSLMKRRGVEASVIGEFSDSGRCVVEYHNANVMDIDMNFLHDGLPIRPMETEYDVKRYEEPSISKLEDLTESLHSMLGRLNIASIEFIAKQYDHEVQGGSVIKPLQGRGRVSGDATITRPVLDSRKGVVISQGINPSYSDIAPYHMAACAIDSAIRGAVAVGADLEHIALLDNFCWCSSNEPERLGQLKEAVKACYHYAVGFGTPFVSGKDSMFNDFKGFDEKGKEVKISVPPTLLVTSIGVMEDTRKAVSLDAKFAGDLVYVLGETNDELGASEYFAMVGEGERGKRYIGNDVPKVDIEKNKRAYEGLSRCIQEGIVSSAQSVHIGGLGVALAKTSMGGKLGMDISLAGLLGQASRDDFALYSESQGRIVVTVAPDNSERFKEIMHGNAFTQVGIVRGDDKFVIRGIYGTEIVRTDVTALERSYKSTFEDY